jgi:hypothetical protein
MGFLLFVFLLTLLVELGDCGFNQQSIFFYAPEIITPSKVDPTFRASFEALDISQKFVR